MNTFIISLVLLIIIGCFFLLVVEGNTLYNQFLAYNFFMQIKNRKFKRAYLITKLIFGKKLKAYLIIELTKALLSRNKIEQAYYIFRRVLDTNTRIIILELIINNCIANKNNEKLEAFIVILSFYENRKFIELYKKLIIYYEHENLVENIRTIENKQIKNLDFYIGLSYIKTDNLEDLKRILYNIKNYKKMGLLLYELFKHYKTINQSNKFKMFYESLELTDEEKLIIEEFLIKIYIEMDDFEKAEELILHLTALKKFDYYILLAKECKKDELIIKYLEKADNLSAIVPYSYKRILDLIKISYVALKVSNIDYTRNKVAKAYELYISNKVDSLDLSKEFILLFREIKNYKMFMFLLEKKVEIYREVLTIENIIDIKPDFLRSVNVFLWGEELKTFENFMTTYNMVQLKEGNLEYDDFYELIHQIKRYVTDETYTTINNISINLSDKPNTMFFINQYLKFIKSES